MNTCEVIDITKYEIWNPHLYREDTINENDYSQLVSEVEDKRSVSMKLTSTSEGMKHLAYIKAMGTQKGKLTCIIIDTGCDKRAWFRVAFHVSYLHNHTASDKLE